MHRREFLQRSRTGVVAASALCLAPSALAAAELRRSVSQGSTAVARAGGGRLVVDPDAGEVVAFAARGREVWRVGGLARPVAVADWRGRTFVSDALAGEVVVIDAGGAVVDRWRGLDQPRGVAAGPDGLFVAESFAHRIRVFDPTGRIRWSLGTRLNAPRGLAFDGTALWVADSGNARVVAFVGDREVAARRVDGWVPRDVAVDDAGGLHVASAIPNAVWSFSRAGRLVGRWAPATGLARSVDLEGSVLSVGVS